ncbi:hypothetical protein BOX15_Mlig009900g3, partial [Macrostomum lignano]
FFIDTTQAEKMSHPNQQQQPPPPPYGFALQGNPAPNPMGGYTALSPEQQQFQQQQYQQQQQQFMQQNQPQIDATVNQQQSMPPMYGLAPTAAYTGVGGGYGFGYGMQQGYPAQGSSYYYQQSYEQLQPPMGFGQYQPTQPAPSQQPSQPSRPPPPQQPPHTQQPPSQPPPPQQPPQAQQPPSRPPRQKSPVAQPVKPPAPKPPAPKPRDSRGVDAVDGGGGGGGGSDSDVKSRQEAALDDLERLMSTDVDLKGFKRDI